MDRTLWSIYPKERKIYNSLTEAVPIGWRIVARLRQQTIARDVTHSNRAVVRGCNDVTAGGRWRKRLASGDFRALLCAWLWRAGLCSVSSGSGVVERKCCHVGSIDLADVTDVNTDVTTAIHVDWARIEVSTENNTTSRIQKEFHKGNWWSQNIFAKTANEIQALRVEIRRNILSFQTVCAHFIYPTLEQW